MKNKIERYRIYNRNRKIKAISFDNVKAAFFFKIIPFLLHCNYPDLPGYIKDRACPYGIHGFPAREFIDPDLFQRYFNDSTAFNINTPSPFTETPCIHSLKTIGSIGTIAQTEKSDCDYWVSIRYREAGGEKGVDLLRRKCAAIEKWALDHGIEVHFFLMDIDQTRENSFDSMAEGESAGSALKILLKDELFRTHILVAGKMLLWWLIPPGLTEQEYRVYVDNLINDKIINPDNFVDLGYISNIPKAEIFGACLWQMNKALDSPFKSIIKFAYLELLLREDSKALSMFSARIKSLVTFPETLEDAPGDRPVPGEVDPYLMLAREIASFYRRKKSDRGQRDSLIRECLFLKTIEGMESQKRKSGQPDRLNATMDLMRDWNLLPENHEYFLKFRFWRYNELVEFGARAHDFLIETYKRLSLTFKNFEDETGLTITERDIAVLGRKLFTFYQKKPHKVDYIKSISIDSMGQDNITFHINKSEGDFSYYALQGEHDHPSAGPEFIIKRDDSIVGLITWLLINGVLTRRSILHLIKNVTPISIVDIQKLVEVMIETFPRIHFAHISGEQLLKPETVIQALIVVNITKEAVRGKKNLRSTLVTANSHGEYFVEQLQTPTQLKNAMRLLLTKHFVSRWNNNLRIHIPDQKEKHYLQEMIGG